MALNRPFSVTLVIAIEPENLRPFVEALDADGGRGQSQVNSLMNHISRRHDYLNGLIEPLVGLAGRR